MCTTHEITEKFCAYSIHCSPHASAASDSDSGRTDDTQLYYVSCQLVIRFYQNISNPDELLESTFIVPHATIATVGSAPSSPGKRRALAADDRLEIYLRLELRALMAERFCDNGNYARVNEWRAVQSANEKRQRIDWLMQGVRAHPDNTFSSDQREEFIAEFLRYYNNYADAFAAIVVCMIIEKNLVACSMNDDSGQKDRELQLEFTRMHIDAAGTLHLLRDVVDAEDEQQQLRFVQSLFPRTTTTTTTTTQKSNMETAAQVLREGAHAIKNVFS